MRHRIALPLIASLVIAGYPILPVDASTTVDDLPSTFLSVRDGLATLRAQTFPTTEEEMRSAIKEVRRQVKRAGDDLADLDGSDPIDDEEADSAFAQAWLTYEDGWQTLEWYAQKIPSNLIVTYEEDAPDVVSELTDFHEDITDLLLNRSGFTFCPTRKIGSTTEDVERVSAVMDELATSVKKLETGATKLVTAEDVELTRWQVERIGTLADARLLSLWRLSEDARDTIDDDVSTLTSRFTALDTAVTTAVGASLALPVKDETADWRTTLNDHIDRLVDEDVDAFDGSWEDARDDHASELTVRLGELRDRAEDMANDAESAWSVSESVRIRREATYVDVAAQIYRMSYRLPLTQSDLRDRDDIIRDISDSTKDTHDNLVDRSLSGWDESDREDELDARFEVSAFSSGGWPNVSNFADLPDDSTLRQGILDLSAARIMLGDGVYVRPYSPVTRAEFMKLVAASACMEPGIRDSASLLRDRLSAFVDTAEFVPTIPTAMNLGGYLSLALDRAIIRGVDSSHLAPNRPITRFEAAKILVGDYGLTLGASASGFTDLATSEQQQYVDAAIAAGFFNRYIPPTDCIGGSAADCDAMMYRAKSFRPNDSLTRGEAAKIIANGVRNQGKALTTLADESIGMIPSDLFMR